MTGARANGPVLVLNAGSSSLKYQLVVPETGEVTAKGIVERIGEPAAPATNHSAAITIMSAALDDAGASVAELRAVGHRVVHGGPDFSDPVIIDDAVLAEIGDLIPLAPLHNPGAVAGIQAARASFAVPHVAVFDTAFFATLPPIVLHLGNGCSASAVRGGVAIETSMDRCRAQRGTLPGRPGDLPRRRTDQCGGDTHQRGAGHRPGGGRAVRCPDRLNATPA